VKAPGKLKHIITRSEKKEMSMVLVKAIEEVI